ncbi:MAG TPA: hypothetical protein EYM58_09060 [Rhodospirillales bacterium]|nr:hypothetical protein [Rhodospirillales bacterium]
MNRTAVYLLSLALAAAVTGGDTLAAGATDPETIAALQKSGRLGVTLKRVDDTLSVTTTGRPSHQTGNFPMMGDYDGDGGQRSGQRSGPPGGGMGGPPPFRGPPPFGHPPPRR